MDIHGLLRAIRERLGLTQAEFAHRVGADAGLVSKRESGVVAPRIRELEKMIDRAGVDVVLTKEGWGFLSDVQRGAPSYGSVPGRAMIKTTEAPPALIGVRELSGGCFEEAEHYWLEAWGQEMEAAGIRDGDWLMVRRCGTGGWKPAVGDLVVANVRGCVLARRIVLDAVREVPVLAPTTDRFGEMELDRYDPFMVQGKVERLVRSMAVG